MSPLLYPEQMVAAVARAFKALEGTPYAGIPLAELEEAERSWLPLIEIAAAGDSRPLLEAMGHLVADRRRRGVKVSEVHRAFRAELAALASGGWTTEEMARLHEAYALGEERMLSLYEQEMERTLSSDYLTGLPNRRSFIERLDEEMARGRRYRVIFSIGLVDVDGFKDVNDRFGHQEGDELLVTLGETLRSGCRERLDLAARIGGDEFGLVFAQTRRDGADSALRRMATTFSECARTPDGRPVSFSFGSAEWRRRDTADLLLRRADVELYRAKAARVHCP